jgi:hypothetical protein
MGSTVRPQKKMLKHKSSSVTGTWDPMMTKTLQQTAVLCLPLLNYDPSWYLISFTGTCFSCIPWCILDLCTVRVKELWLSSVCHEPLAYGCSCVIKEHVQMCLIFCKNIENMSDFEYSPVFYYILSEFLYHIFFCVIFCISVIGVLFTNLCLMVSITNCLWS